MGEQTDLFGEAREGVGAAPAAAEHRDVASRLPPRLRLGTSSWSFPGWAGVVWDRTAPARTLARHGLRAYARHPLLRTVCVDRSYYRPLDGTTWEEYAAAVPPDFRFVTKAERVLVRPDDGRFLDGSYATDVVVGPYLEAVGGAAGPVLFQFPPFPPRAAGGPRRFAERLYRFLEALPPEGAYAVELRSPGLMTGDYATALRHGSGVHGYVAHPRMLPLAVQLERIPPGDVTGPASGGGPGTSLAPERRPAPGAAAGPEASSERPRPFVVRWMLREDLGYEQARDLYEPFDRLVDEDVATRTRIATAALEAVSAGREAFVVVNNKAEGSSPLSVIRLAEWIAAGGGRSRP